MDGGCNPISSGPAHALLPKGWLVPPSGWQRPSLALVCCSDCQPVENTGGIAAFLTEEFGFLRSGYGVEQRRRLQHCLLPSINARELVSQALRIVVASSFDIVMPDAPA